jgi:hypothetical protein
MWIPRLNPFGVKRDGSPILSVSIKDGVNPGITWNESFFHWEAATQAGLDIWRWENGEYPKWFMAKTVAWYILHIAVGNHREDAMSAAAKRKSKR